MSAAGLAVCTLLTSGGTAMLLWWQKRDGYLAALREAIELATTSLRRDLELAGAFPESLDLPHFTARLRYKKLSDHMLHIFTGPGVVAYDHLVMVDSTRHTHPPCSACTCFPRPGASHGFYRLLRNNTSKRQHMTW